jgi:CDP-diacylglycerol--glycerol-3-phosphate 3-phosphatidyltransferase
LIDGLLARRWGQVTELGKVLDPFADCISRFSVFLCFMFAGYAHIFMVALIFYRDIIVANIRIAAAMKGTVIHARTSGKIKAVAQAVVILTVITGINVFGKEALNFRVFSLWAMGLLTAVTVWSGVDYTLGFLRVVRPAEKE